MNTGLMIMPQQKLQFMSCSIENICSHSAHIHRDFEVGVVLCGEAAYNTYLEAAHCVSGDVVCLNPNSMHEVDSPGA